MFNSHQLTMKLLGFLAGLWASIGLIQGLPTFLQDIDEYGFCGDLTYTANNDGSYTLHTNGNPNHPTWKTNPNTPSTQDFNFRMSSSPSYEDEPYCLNGGPIGVAINGIPFFNFMSNECKNAVAGCSAETFDGCGGHSDQSGVYHYHKCPNLQCLFGDSTIPTTPKLIGIARDGLPMYVSADTYYDRNGLDECNGKTTEDGYRYYVTQDFPYTIGCYRARPLGGMGMMNVDQSCSGMESGMACACPGFGNCNGQNIFSYADEGMSGCFSDPVCWGERLDEQTTCAAGENYPTNDYDIFTSYCMYTSDCVQTC